MAIGNLALVYSYKKEQDILVITPNNSDLQLLIGTTLTVARGIKQNLLH